MDAKQIGLFLYKLRKDQGLTQKDISLMTNVTAQAVSKWERGESIPDIEVLEKLSLLYKISINELISGEKKELLKDTALRRNVMSLILSVFVFLVYLFPYVVVRTPDFFPGIDEVGITFKGFYLIFNGLSGPIVISAMVVFFLLLTQVFLNIFLILSIIPRKSWITPYLQITTTGIFFISLLHLALKDFYLLPQIILMLIMVIQFILITDEENQGILSYLANLSWSNFKLPKPLIKVNKWQFKILKSIYWLTFTGYIISASWFVIYNVRSINANFSSEDYIFLIGTLSYMIILIVFMLRNYKFVFNGSELKRVLPSILVTSALPIYILIVIIFNDYTASSGFMWKYFIQDISILIGLSIAPINIIVATKSIK
jgi:transcriptional regulator with XRE-family HTH domain